MNKSVQRVGRVFFILDSLEEFIKECMWELAFETSLVNSERSALFVSLLLWNSQKGAWAKSVQENWVAYVQEFLMFFFCAQSLLEVGSEVNLKRAGGVSLCSWESSLNLKQNFFLAEGGGVNKKCIRQTFCCAVILWFLHLGENKFLSLEMLFFSEAVGWQFSRGKSHMLQVFLSINGY